MDLVKIFDEISAQMLSDFEKSRQALSHAGLKGDANEEIVRSFLRQYLPNNLEISSGIVVDSNGNKSRQLDIILHDSAKTPVFYQNTSTRVIPIECVYAVIEVKAFLDKNELEKCFENMKSLKTLEKKAFFESNSVIVKSKSLYGKQWQHWPVQHFVFAFDSPSIQSVYTNFMPLNMLLPVHKRIDSIFILNKGLIFNREKNEMVSILPTAESKIVMSESEKRLLLFYSLLSIILNQAEMDCFNIKPYLGNINF